MTTNTHVQVADEVSEQDQTIIIQAYGYGKYRKVDCPVRLPPLQASVIFGRSSAMDRPSTYAEYIIICLLADQLQERTAYLDLCTTLTRPDHQISDKSFKGCTTHWRHIMAA